MIEVQQHCFKLSLMGWWQWVLLCSPLQKTLQRRPEVKLLCGQLGQRFEACIFEPSPPGCVIEQIKNCINQAFIRHSDHGVTQLGCNLAVRVHLANHGFMVAKQNMQPTLLYYPKIVPIMEIQGDFASCQIFSALLL